MKPTPRPAAQDHEIDRLLARHYRDTSPEFEARWRELRREWQGAPAPRRGWLGWPTGPGAWLGLAAAASLAGLLVMLRPAAPPAPGFSPTFAELFALEDILGRATPLLDPENRDALLHLPVKPSPRT